MYVIIGTVDMSSATGYTDSRKAAELQEFLESKTGRVTINEIRSQVYGGSESDGEIHQALIDCGYKEVVWDL